MKTTPKYLMDTETFYWNPEYPDLFDFPPEFTAEDIRNVRVPIRIFRNGEVLPGTKLPLDVEENTRILT